MNDRILLVVGDKFASYVAHKEAVVQTEKYWSLVKVLATKTVKRCYVQRQIRPISISMIFHYGTNCLTEQRLYMHTRRIHEMYWCLFRVRFPPMSLSWI